MKWVRFISLSADHEIDQQRDASDEQEGVGLEITRLNEAQRAAKQFGGAMRAAHRQSQR